jgi:hypothetical protein
MHGSDSILEAQSSLLFTLRICAVGVAVSSGELLYRQRNLFRDTGLMGWTGLSNSQALSGSSRFSRVLSKLMRPVAFRCVLLVRLVAALLVVLSWGFSFSNNMMTGLVTLILISTFAHHLRLPIGTDGSDHMNAIVLTTGTIGLFFSSYKIYVVCAIFITAQLMLSYWVAGIAKIISVDWRLGGSTSCILSTWTYGLPPVGEFIHRHMLLSRLIDWSVIVFELLFPFGWFLPGKVLIFVLVIGILFHLSNALVMGLNTFLFAFTSAYPCAFFTILLVRRFLVDA